MSDLGELKREQEFQQRQEAERQVEQERSWAKIEQKKRQATESENMRLKERLRELGIDSDEGG